MSGVLDSEMDGANQSASEEPNMRVTEQQQIVRRVEALFALADQIEARFEKAQAQVDKLTASLLPAPSPADPSLLELLKGNRR